MKKYLIWFFSILAISSLAYAAAGDRAIHVNSNEDGDSYIQVNKGGVATKVLDVDGATGVVDFPVGAKTKGLSGADLTAVSTAASGYVGEVLSTGTASSTAIGSSGTAETVRNLNLTPGVWVVTGSVFLFRVASTGYNAAIRAGLRLNNSADTGVSGIDGNTNGYGMDHVDPSVASSTEGTSMNPSAIIVVTESINLKLNVLASWSSGSPPTWRASLRAVRIQ
jgi:hypothetical protein